MKTINIKCYFCGRAFDKTISEYHRINKLSGNHFCSLSCSAKSGIVLRQSKWKNKREEYYLNPNTCENCKTVISYEQRNEKVFCSNSCAAAVNNKKRMPKKTMKTCLYCHKETKNQKFCSMNCSHSNKINVTNYKIETGEKVSSIAFKRFLTKEKGHKCAICNLSEWGGKPILLILDHINGDSDNHQLSNLRLICSNCDTLTSTYKGRNKGNGRFSRRQRYQNNQSY